MNRLTNRRRSDGTHLDGRHGICGLCDGSSWHCIMKWDTLSWLGHTRFCTTVRVSKQEQMMFESSSKNRKSWGGRQMIRQCIPDTRSNRWEWFRGCHGGFTCGNTYWQRWRRAECSRRYISRDERSKIGWLLRLYSSTLWVTVAILKLILWRTGSQCKSERTGVMWQNRGFCATTRARVFWTRWRRARLETWLPFHPLTFFLSFSLSPSLSIYLSLWFQPQNDISAYT